MNGEPFVLTPESTEYLSTAQKWAMFLAVIGFIGVALLVLMGIFIGFIFNFAELPSEYNTAVSAISVLSSIVYIIIAIVYFIPVWYLFQFSRRLRRALHMEDREILEESFRNLKNCFVTYGVLTILAIIFYGIFFVISFFTAVGTMGGMTV